MFSQHSFAISQHVSSAFCFNSIVSDIVLSADLSMWHLYFTDTFINITIPKLQKSYRYLMESSLKILIFNLYYNVH